MSQGGTGAGTPRKESEPAAFDELPELPDAEMLPWTRVPDAAQVAVSHDHVWIRVAGVWVRGWIRFQHRLPDGRWAIAAQYELPGTPWSGMGDFVVTDSVRRRERPAPTGTP